MTFFRQIFTSFTRKERIVFACAALGAVASFLVVMGFFINHSTTPVPAPGGEYTEGVLGQPEYVNPVIASSEADLDLVKMIYSPLTSLADSITVSPDLRTYTVRLKDNLFWQDGQPLTADDVVFTVQSIQNPDANSPLYQSWQGVTVTRESELEVQFTLAAPYAFFGDDLQNLYILPKHIFANTPPGNWHLSDYNLKPVGSGPYEFVSYTQDSTGFISSYDLKAWNGTSEAQGLIQNYHFNYFNDENTLVTAFNNGQINGMSAASPEDVSAIKRPYQLFTWPTSAYYAVFLNQSVSIPLEDPVVREALSVAIDRNALVTDALGGEGVPDYGPIPPTSPYYVAPAAATTSAAYAEQLLDNDGWTVSSSTGFRAKTIGGTSIPLTINLTVPQIDFLANTADYLRDAWQAIGVQVNVMPDSPDDIASTVIPDRNYEAILFGNVLGPSSDLYSFWDSSEDFAPGLNLSIYNNPKVDALIADARENTSSTAIAADMASAQADIEADMPAIFLYSPDDEYIADTDLQGVTTSTILTDPSDRLEDVSSWYLETARVGAERGGGTDLTCG